jgi:hypothetical protein
VKIFFLLDNQENNAFSRVPRTRELLFSNCLRNVPEKYSREFLHAYLKKHSTASEVFFVPKHDGR